MLVNHTNKKSLAARWPKQVSAFFRITSPPGGIPTWLLNPVYTDPVFAFSFNSIIGRTYTARYATNIVGPWTPLQVFNGTGGLIAVYDSAAVSASRFYSVTSVANVTQRAAAPLLKSVENLPLVTETGLAFAAL